MNIKILYEDSDIVVIDKPSGIAVHADGRTKEETVTDWVLTHFPEMKGVGELLGDVERPGVVHRLDRETSGVLVLAKNQEAHQFLKKQFQEKKIKKVYHAIVSGWIKNDSGVIDKAIGRSPSDFRRRLAGRGARGEQKEAMTEYKVLKRFEDNGEKFTYLEVIPKTGRTHQIRVHMKYLSHPVACDKLYNPGKACPAGFSRLALHAKSIEFQKLDGKTTDVESSLPVEFENLRRA